MLESSSRASQRCSRFTTSSSARSGPNHGLPATSGRRSGRVVGGRACGAAHSWLRGSLTTTQHLGLAISDRSHAPNVHQAARHRLTPLAVLDDAVPDHGAVSICRAGSRVLRSAVTSGAAASGHRPEHASCRADTDMLRGSTRSRLGGAQSSRDRHGHGQLPSSIPASCRARPKCPSSASSTSRSCSASTRSRRGSGCFPMSISMLAAALAGPKVAARRGPRTVVQVGLGAMAIAALVLVGTIDVTLNGTSLADPRSLRLLVAAVGRRAVRATMRWYRDLATRSRRGFG